MAQGERFNSITHLTGAILAVGGTAILVTRAAFEGDPWKIVSVSVYGASLITLYLFSTLYHSIGNSLFRKLDHGAIYLLIAGSYTPFALVTLRGPLGWTIFGATWGLAALGITIDLLLADRRRIVPVFFYLFMGWLAVFTFKPLLRVLPLTGFRWLLAGGLLYTVGILFYALDGRLRLSHGIWHLFVLAGSFAQFMAVLLFVL